MACALFNNNNLSGISGNNSSIHDIDQLSDENTAPQHPEVSFNSIISNITPPPITPLTLDQRFNAIETRFNAIETRLTNIEYDPDGNSYASHGSLHLSNLDGNNQQNQQLNNTVPLGATNAEQTTSINGSATTLGLGGKRRKTKKQRKIKKQK